ncbi:MAG: hypothetical protein LBF93_02415 [Zoogloeaceae bacterium]|nr:hypothetical protein [Zoogloeaceae bacterium]
MPESGVKASKAAPGTALVPTTPQATPEQVKAAEDFLTRVLGNDVDVEIAAFLGEAGLWIPQGGKRTLDDGTRTNLIKLSMNGDVLGAAYHEAMHEFFHRLARNGLEEVREHLLRVARLPFVQKQLARLLNEFPDAVTQLSDPEEALAFMFQFWLAGKLKLSKKTQDIFEKIRELFGKTLRAVQNLLSHRMREQHRAEDVTQLQTQFAENVMTLLASGGIASGAAKDASFASLRADERALAESVRRSTSIAQWILRSGLAQLVTSTEALLFNSDNPAFRRIALLFQQNAGYNMAKGEGRVMNSMGEKSGAWRGGYLTAAQGETSRWMNKLAQAIGGFDSEDLDLARRALLEGTMPAAPEAARAAEAIKAYYEAFWQEVGEEGGVWTSGFAENVRTRKRKDYGFTRMWDNDLVAKNAENFMSCASRRARLSCYWASSRSICAFSQAWRASALASFAEHCAQPCTNRTHR